MTDNKIVKVAAFVIVTSGIILLMIFAKSIIMPMMIGAFLAMLLVPLVNKMQKMKIPGPVAIFIAILLSISVLTGLGWFFGAQISSFSNDLTDIEARFDDLSAQFSAFMEEVFGVKNAMQIENLNDKFFTFLKDNASTITSAAFSTLSSLGQAVLIPVYLFMFLLYRNHFTTFAVKLFPSQPAEWVIDVVTDLRRVIQLYITGALKVMFILAILNSIALTLLGIKHALFFAVFAAILNIVPYIGPLIASLLPIVFALLTKDSLWYPIGVFISFSIIQTIEGNYLTPKIVGSTVSINPLTSLLALLIGGFMWGVAGMILFIPMAAILKKLLELSPKTEVYGYLLGEEPNEGTKNETSLTDWLKKLIRKRK